MSGRKHRSVAAEVTYILAEIKGKNKEQVQDLYGIEIRNDGTVFDFTYDITFDDLAKWVHFNNEQDDTEYEERFTSGRYDDESY
jgi:hypothetical protein